MGLSSLLLVGLWNAAVWAQMGNGADAGTATPSAATTGTVSGQVINAKTGTPVSRALVRLNDRAVMTDHEGKFEISQYTEESGNLQVIKPGYSTASDLFETGGQVLRLSQVTEPLELKLYPEALLTGTVTGPDGYPLPRILVNVNRSMYDDDFHRWNPAGQTVTDSHGNFRITVPAGEYRLETMYMPRNNITADAIFPVVLPSENSSEVIRIRSGEEQHFDLHPSVSKTHAVTLAMEGSERGYPTIIARSSHGVPLRVNGVPNTGDGYKIDLPSGTYTLMATMNTPEGVEQGETAVTVTDHDVSGIVLRMSPVPRIPVEVVVDQGVASDDTSTKAPSAAQFGLVLENESADARQGDPVAHLTPQRDGSYGFAVSPGSYRFAAHNRSDWYIKSVNYGASDLLGQELVVTPGAGGMPIRVVVSNQTGSLQGTVKLNGEPAACWIYLVSRTASASPVISLRSSSDGTFTVQNLAPGSYEAVSFEYRHSADYANPESLATYSTHVKSVSIQAGDKGSLDLETVSAAELAP
jgi:hypothetical protein